MVYTNSVRMAVVRRIIREHLNIDDTAFEALVDQELAKQKADEEEAREKAKEESKKAAVDKAVEELKDGQEGEEGEEEPAAEVETKEFGGDFGDEVSPDEQADTAKEHDPDSAGEEDGDSGGAVDGAGSDTDGVRPVAGDGEEGQPADSV